MESVEHVQNPRRFNRWFKDRYKAWLTVFGGFLVHLSLGTVYCFGE